MEHHRRFNHVFHDLMRPNHGTFLGGLQEDFQRRGNGNKSPTEELRREGLESESAYRGHVPKTVC